MLSRMTWDPSALKNAVAGLLFARLIATRVVNGLFTVSLIVVRVQPRRAIWLNFRPAVGMWVTKLFGARHYITFSRLSIFRLILSRRSFDGSSSSASEYDNLAYSLLSGTS